MSQQRPQEEMKTQLYWQAVVYGREQIYEQQTDQILSYIQQGDNPAKSIGQMVSDLVSTIVSDGVDKGLRFTRPVVQKLFKTLISDVAQLAAIKGVLQITSQEEVNRLINEALIRATEDYAIKVKEKTRGNPAYRDANETPERFKTRNGKPIQKPTPAGQSRGLMRG